MPLTDTECRNAKCPPGRARLRMTDGLGLYLEVLPAGGRYWRLKYRHQGKEKRLGLGVYPAVTLASARKERERARALLESGQDPSEARKESKAAQAAASETTFEAVARSWHEQWKRYGPGERHGPQLHRPGDGDVRRCLGRGDGADGAAISGRGRRSPGPEVRIQSRSFRQSAPTA
jgi:hypothetical protein